MEVLAEMMECPVRVKNAAHVFLDAVLLREI